MEFRLSSTHGLLRSRPRGRPGRALPIWGAVLIVAASLLSSQPALVRATAVAPVPRPRAAPRQRRPATSIAATADSRALTLPGGFLEYSAGATEMRKWSIDSARVDMVSAPHWEAPAGNQVLDLDGTSGVAGRTVHSQTVPTTPGTAYELGFVYSGTPTAATSATSRWTWSGMAASWGPSSTTPSPTRPPGSLATFDYRQPAVRRYRIPHGTGRRRQGSSSSSRTAEWTCGIVIDDVYVVHATPPVWQSLGDGTTTVIEDGSDGRPSSRIPRSGWRGRGQRRVGIFTTATTERTDRPGLVVHRCGQLGRRDGRALGCRHRN